jgi:hypothetical protein
VASTRETFGFLFVDYGSSAWWWEVEELLRKLLLSAVVVLIEEGSPLQVTLAVLVSGWAHVLHAMYKPWGAGSVLYSLQHGALFVTSFVFLMGLLFKVDGVSSSSSTYSALSGIMVTLCAAFIAAWVSVVVAGVVSIWRSSRRDAKAPQPSRGRFSITSPPSTSSSTSDVHGVDLAGGVGGSSASARGTRQAALAVRTGVENTGADVGGASDDPVALSGPGFVVNNPLRRPLSPSLPPACGSEADDGASVRGVRAVEGSRAGAGARDATGERSHAAASSSGPAMTLTLSSSSSSLHGSLAAYTTMTPRLQRVLAAQRPVQLPRGVIDTSTQSADV